jgi:hypothetical protein
MPARAFATASAACVLLAALALVSQTTLNSYESASALRQPLSLDSADDQPIFSVPSDSNPNAGWRGPYAKEGVLTRARGLDAVLGHEGYLNDHREINEDTVPTYDNIVKGQFNHKMHLPFRALVDQISRFRLPPAPQPLVAVSMKRLYRNVDSRGPAAAGSQQGAGLKRGTSSAKSASHLAKKAKLSLKQLQAEKRKLAAKAAAEARLYHRLWQEQGSDFSSSPRGSKVSPLQLLPAQSPYALSLDHPALRLQYGFLLVKPHSGVQDFQNLVDNARESVENGGPLALQARECFSSLRSAGGHGKRLALDDMEDYRCVFSLQTLDVKHITLCSFATVR